MEFLNQIKKAVASFTLGALLFGFVTPVANAQLGFTDDAEIPSWAFDAIDELMAQGVIGGNDDGSFAPNRQLNRAEVSKIIVLASGVDLDTTGGPHFPDVAASAWYYDYVETMYNNGWINGYPDGNFRPEVGINRAEIAKMVVNAFEIDPDTAGAPHFDDVTSGDWFYSYVETAYNYGLMRGYGDGTFGPADPVTRAQTTKIVYDSQLVVTSPTGPAEGTLEVTLSSDTPRGTNIPFNATSVPFTTVELTASDDSDVEISSLTFTRLGLGDNDDFDNVWLEIDGFKVGNDKSVNNDDIVELRFNPPVVIPAGQTVVADLVASLEFDTNDQNIGHHNRFAVVSADDVASTAANVVGDFPVEGEEMEVASYEVSQLDFDTLGSDTTIDVGDNFIEIGKFKLENQSNSNKDIEVRALTFKNDGVAELEDVLENVALYVSGEQVSAETIIDGDYVTFRLDNGVTGGYIIEDGDSRIFSIRADIVSAEKGDTINFKVDNFEDVVGVEIGTSFGVKAISDETITFSGTTTTDGAAVTDADAEDNNARLRAYSIDSGDLNVSRDPSSLSNQEYAPGSNDVVFLTARLVVDQPLIVDGVTIDLNDSNNIADLAELNNSFDNFRLFLNDKLVDSENEFGGANLAAANLDFNTTFEIAGTSVLKVVGNIESVADTGDRIKLSVDADNFASPEYISTGDQVEADELLGSAEASFVEIESSVLTISKSDGLSPTGDSIVAGVDDVTFVEFILDNNDSGDVNVTSVSVDAVGVPNGGLTNVQTYSNYTAAIFVDGKQQGSSKNFTTGGLATFNDLSVVIPTAGQKEFVVVVDTIEAIFGQAGDTIAFNVVAVDADNVENGQTVVVNEGGAALVDGVNELAGSVFTVIESGQLSVERVNVNPESQVLVAGATDIEISRIKLIAADDDVEVQDIYFTNDTVNPAVPGTTDVEDRLDFILKDASGNTIERTTMVDGSLHFELADADRIRVPKDSSVNVSVHVDVRSITEENQTGERIALELDLAQGVNGFEANTSATGTDLPAGALNAATEDALAETYIAYRTNLEFSNATTQPTLSSKGAVGGAGVANPIFRFGVSADAAYGATLDRLTFEITSSDGVLLGDDGAVGGGDDTSLDADATASNVRVFRYSSSAYTGTPTEVTLDGAASSVTVAAGVSTSLLDFADSEDIEAGETVYYEIHTTEQIVDVAANDTDQINVRFLQDTVPTAGTNVQWTDRSNAGSENAAQLNGYELVYPSDSDGSKQ